MMPKQAKVILFAALLLCSIMLPMLVANRAVILEERVWESQSNLWVQEQRRYDLYLKFEETVEGWVEQAIAGEQSDMIIQALVDVLMTENLIAKYRMDYNEAVRRYRAYVRRFPNKAILRWIGHDVVDFQFLEMEYALGVAS